MVESSAGFRGNWLQYSIVTQLGVWVVKGAELELVATAKAKAMLKSTVDPNTNVELKSVVWLRPRWVWGYGRVKDMCRQSPRPSRKLMLS